ncbi:MAG: AraC family transcriptional regulator [Cyclobacteriaceae bacterium]
MKLVYQDNNTRTDKALQVVKKDTPCFDSSWHYHPEFELIFISKSIGLRYVGDNVSNFSPGELVLIGPYLPHLWRSDQSYYKTPGANSINTMVIKFTRNFIGEDTFDFPAFNKVNELLKMSNFGVLFDKRDSAELQEDIYGIIDLSEAERAIKLLDILNRLARLDSKEILSTTDMRQVRTESVNRIDKVLKFISDNYVSDISLEDVADVACMTTNSFCRFFKKATNKSFITFLNEVRIKNAARLLVQEDLPISDVGFKVGFNSITNFNKQFKQIMNVSPNEHRFSIYADNLQRSNQTLQYVP